MPQILYGLNTAEEILNGGRRRVMKLYIVKGGKKRAFRQNNRLPPAGKT